MFAIRGHGLSGLRGHMAPMVPMAPMGPSGPQWSQWSPMVPMAPMALESTAPSALGVTGALENAAPRCARSHFCASKSPRRGHLALQKHCAGVRFRLPGPLSASETLRRRAFSPAQANWRLRNTAQACVSASPGALCTQSHWALENTAPSANSEPLGRSKTPGPVHSAPRRCAFAVAVRSHCAK
jgi:hypothetical protein